MSTMKSNKYSLNQKKKKKKKKKKGENVPSDICAQNNSENLIYYKLNLIQK